jgi:cyanate permease
MLFAALSERLNRRKAFFLWFALAWLSALAFFWGVQGSGADAFSRAVFLAPIMGFCTLGPFAGYTVYFPELFPTRLRATGCGFCYNAARILAALAPFALGKLSDSLGGYAQAATVVLFIGVLGFVGTAMAPETKGQPLPE